MKKCLCLMSVVLCLTASASHIEETLKLAKGWNGVYLESTPDTADCADFFRGLQVSKVMLYDGKGNDGQPLLDENGQDILQPPVYYYTWNAATLGVGTLKSLVGGRCYLIFASNAVTKVFTGVPKQPINFWRVTDDTNSIMNLVSVSCDPKTNVTAQAYFGEGPYDGKQVYKIGGTDESKPTPMPLLGSSPKLSDGVAYSLSANRAGEWPGVIAVQNDQVNVLGGSGTLTFGNSSKKNRTFRLTMVESADPDERFPPLMREESVRSNIAASPRMTEVVADQGWEVSVASNHAARITFNTIPSRMVVDVTYAAVLQIEDLSGSAMRVRVPVKVLDSAPQENDVAGLWVGAMALGEVSSIDGERNPLPAAGIMPLKVIVHVDSSLRARLLQRAVVVANSNGSNWVCCDLKDLPAGWTVRDRMFTAMMSVDAPVAVEVGGPGFGTTKGVDFTWGVPERAKDNPFRHAWHPDHDGLSADYTRETPTGDDPANYQNPIKPELWSITNTLSFKLDGKYVPNADETMEGGVVWDVGGLVSTNTIRSTGRFLLRRILKNVEFVK